MKTIYLDNAATTQVRKEVLSVMKPYFSEIYGNPSEPHSMGRKAWIRMEKAREEIADFLHSKPDEIVFTSSATESINLFLKGLIESIKVQEKSTRPHIITSSVEHKAVINTCLYLSNKKLAEVSFLPVNRDGQISLLDIERAITKETVIISIMYVNNEVGTIQPIDKVGRLVKKVNKKRSVPIYFHTDATQAIGHLDCNVNRLGVDSLSFSGHKIYAPKGIGALYVRSNTPLVKQLYGGFQENGLRAGTENVAYIIGLAKAIGMITKTSGSDTNKISKLKKRLIKNVSKVVGVKLLGNPKTSAPHIISFLVKGVEGESLVLYLSERGIYASSGSACSSSTLEPSHVLTAMGIIREDVHGSIRFSLGRNNSDKDIDYLSCVFPEVVEDLRNMAPKK